MIQKNNKLLILLLFFTVACKQEEVKTEFVARVNDEFLTAEEVDSSLSLLKYNAKLRDEFIREWIEREVLFLEAQNRGIDKSDLVKGIMKNSEKELSAAFLLQNLLENMEYKFSNGDLLRYYQKHKDEFKLTSRAFVFNKITFDNKENAIRFRAAVLDSDWQKALNVYARDRSLINYEMDKLFYIHEIYPQLLLRYLNNLRPLEISVVFETEPKQFSVVQIKKKYEEDDIPEFELIRNKVKNTYLLHLRKDFMNEYINDLLSKYDVELIRQEE